VIPAQSVRRRAVGSASRSKLQTLQAKLKGCDKLNAHFCNDIVIGNGGNPYPLQDLTRKSSAAKLGYPAKDPLLHPSDQQKNQIRNFLHAYADFFRLS
jgi:hypothetical protein